MKREILYFVTMIFMFAWIPNIQAQQDKAEKNLTNGGLQDIGSDQSQIPRLNCYR